MFAAGLSSCDLLGDTTHKMVKDDYRFIKPFKEEYLSEKNLRGYLY